MLQRHANEGESIAEAIRDCLDYGKNPEKTEDGKYISSYECDPATVAAEFLLAKASYKAMTGREQKQGEDVLCYQIRQSFYPGEITPEEANRVSYDLAMRWTKGRHAFIVTTHTDKQHIHSHIYYNSTTLDYTRKFRNFWGSSFALRRLSDRLCLENGLSIVENPKPRSKGKFRNYGEWQAGQKKPLTYQDRLRAAIDTALAKKPADFPAFLSLMEQAGYEVKQRRGAISFRAPGQERFTRLRSDTLGEGYSETDIRAALSGSRQRPGQPRQKINLATGGFSNSSLEFEDANEEQRLFYDSFSKRYFQATISQVLQAEYHINRNMVLGAFVTLNDFYDFLGISHVEGGDVVGWLLSDSMYWIDFDNSKARVTPPFRCGI